ncbi:class I adenylate-forming enzyme family protein [Xenorhabdus bovienii]|uniref:class I adenylate-forming enzyme family protein n=1 Tax=Xenorhabdus bovienii TaxID=40576 RepID=UPI0023B2472A|nr:class I adenylate-forming enzyme family protein [Xenorhabdus bovienii]MDE9432202.1 acyl--CoA ligase [Xenorhabdus bovienii]MDE9490163.1 acyl--CoA ligase [Xenorhabdus bovienii]MDE9506439.1 acyl--CoA ligase [Xenorhabdus bovienii]MDE9546543.1 acyl--CoA ligase [Xenorhabdus bovienii]
MITPEEIKKIISSENIGAGNFIHHLNNYFSERGMSPKITCDAPTYDNPEEEKSQFEINDLIKISDQLSGAYIALGVQKREPVALYFDDTIDYLIHFIALNNIGSFPIFVNGDLSSHIAMSFMRNSGTKFIISTEERINSLDDKSTDIQFITPNELNLLKKPISSYYQHHADDIILLGHTSGTTGLPKPVIFTHESMFHGILKEVSKQRGKQILSMFPHSHGASMTLIMLTLTRGAAIHIQSKKTAFDILDSIEQIKPDTVAAFPKIFVDLCREDLDDWDLDSISHWVSTGDANHEPHIRKLISYGHHFVDGKKERGSFFIDNLGSSEFAFAMFRNIHQPKTDRYDRCIGIPFSWVDAAILDADGNVLPNNQVGMLGVISKSVTMGYWNNHLLTEKNRVNGYWLTGDLVYRTNDGFFYHVDRTSDWIKTPQGPLYSTQCEEWLLKNIDSIFDISIVATSLSNGDQQTTAIVELKAGHEISPATLLQKINACHQEKQWPLIDNIVYQSADNDLGVTGKKLKRKIRDRMPEDNSMVTEEGN